MSLINPLTNDQGSVLSVYKVHFLYVYKVHSSAAYNVQWSFIEEIRYLTEKTKEKFMGKD